MEKVSTFVDVGVHESRLDNPASVERMLNRGGRAANRRLPIYSDAPDRLARGPAVRDENLLRPAQRDFGRPRAVHTLEFEISGHF